MVVPGWLDGLTWWHVYPLGFSGAESRMDQAPHVYHRLRHVMAWLDYASGLGVGGLQLGPIQASRTHGYDTVDYLRIDRRLGDEKDFEDLVAACRARGLRLLLDGVFNHVSPMHPRFQQAMALGEEGQGGWFRISWTESGPSFGTFEGHDELVTLDHQSRQVRDHIVEVMKHWLARGADGWRLDAAYAVEPDFWQEVVGRVREEHPDAWFVGEVLHDEWDYLDRSGLDSVTAYGIWAALARSLNEGNLHDLAWPIGRLGDCAAHPPLTFVGNHDVTRLASSLTNQRHFGHALAILFTLPGVPAVYYGDEQAFRGIKETGYGGDDAIRPMFPDRPDQLAPWGWPVYRLHEQLIWMRRNHPWLTRGTAVVESVANRSMLLTTRGDGHAMSALLNIGDAPHEFRGITGQVLASSAADGDDPGHVPAQSWRIVLRRG